VLPWTWIAESHSYAMSSNLLVDVYDDSWQPQHFSELIRWNTNKCVPKFTDFQTNNIVMEWLRRPAIQSLTTSRDGGVNVVKGCEFVTSFACR
jgi:hypothetical protein